MHNPGTFREAKKKKTNPGIDVQLTDQYVTGFLFLILIHTKYSHDPFPNFICEASLTQRAEPDEDKRGKLQTNIPYLDSKSSVDSI